MSSLFVTCEIRVAHSIDFYSSLVYFSKYEFSKLLFSSSSLAKISSFLSLD